MTLITSIAPRIGGRRQEGQGLVEYALILVLIAIVVIGALAFLGAEIEDMISTIGASV